MCSLSGDVMLESKSGKLSQLDKCIKCLTEQPAVVLRKTDAYCKSCFLAATVHKFRATLGKYRIIRPSDRVLILHQAGHASTALLHFIRCGLDLETHKKLRLEPVVLYINEQQKLTEDEYEKIYKSVATEVTSLNFSGYFTSLGTYMNNINDAPAYVEINNTTDGNTLKSLFTDVNTKFPSRTLGDDASDICRRQLLIKMAKILNCGIIFTPDISIDVAINMLSSVSLGRGAHIPLDVGIFDDRDPEVKILQPLRYFEMKELAFYNIFNNLEPLSTKKQTNTKSPATSSVNNLITKFVSGLQVNFPSTIKTIVRTGDKLSCDKSGNICDLCKAPIEIQQDLSSSEARTFSHWISTRANNLNSNEVNSETIIEKNHKLCYGCRNIPSLLEL